MEVSIQEQIAQLFRYTLKFQTEYNFSKLNSIKSDQNTKDYEILEMLIPGIIDNIAKIAYEETFGQISGSNLTRALKIKTFMSKRYNNLREIIGDKRFYKFVDFPEKIRGWRKQNFTEKQIEAKFIKSVVQLYLTAAKRDPSVFQVEILPIIREWIKNSLESINKDKYSINSLTLDRISKDFIKKIDLGRVNNEFKEIFRDIQTYSMLIFFLKKFPDYGFITEETKLVSILDKIREILFEIVQGLKNIPNINEKIIQSYEAIKKES